MAAKEFPEAAFVRTLWRFNSPFPPTGSPLILMLPKISFGEALRTNSELSSPALIKVPPSTSLTEILSTSSRPRKSIVSKAELKSLIVLKPASLRSWIKVPSPLPLLRVSLPAPPSRMSSPLPPLRMLSPAPPFRVSSPAPPRRFRSAVADAPTSPARNARGCTLEISAAVVASPALASAVFR